MFIGLVYLIDVVLRLFVPMYVQSTCLAADVKVKYI